MPTANAPAQVDPAAKPTMRDAYKALTKWVLDEIEPMYSQADIGLPPEVVASIVKTLFDSACAAGKVA